MKSYEDSAILAIPMDTRPHSTSAHEMDARDADAVLFRVESAECLRQRIREFVRTSRDRWSQIVENMILAKLDAEEPDIVSAEREFFVYSRARDLQQKKIKDLFTLPFAVGTRVQWSHHDEAGVYLGPTVDEKEHADPAWARVRFGNDDQEIMILPATALIEVDAPSEDVRGL